MIALYFCHFNTELIVIRREFIKQFSRWLWSFTELLIVVYVKSDLSEITFLANFHVAQHDTILSVVERLHESSLIVKVEIYHAERNRASDSDSHTVPRVRFTMFNVFRVEGDVKGIERVFGMSSDEEGCGCVVTVSVDSNCSVDEEAVVVAIPNDGCSLGDGEEEKTNKDKVGDSHCAYCLLAREKENVSSSGKKDYFAEIIFACRYV